MAKIQTGELRNSIIVTSNSNSPITITLPTLSNISGREFHIEYKHDIQKVDKKNIIKE